MAGAALMLRGSAGLGVAWVGARVRCSPPALEQHGAPGTARGALLAASLFIDARSTADRVWAAELALRSGVCAAVIADGSGFDLSDTRRLQLAAEAGARAGGGLCLLARPPWETCELSAAATRWLVRRAASPNFQRRWSVELLRCKGMQPSSLAAMGRPWVVERDDATGSLRVVADVRDGRGQEAAGALGGTAPAPAARTG